MFKFLTGIAGAFALLCMIAFANIVSIESDAKALSKPIANGRSRRIVVTETATRIPANGQNCNLVVSNVEALTKKFPVYVGYQQPDGGVPTGAQLCANAQPMCDNSVTTFTACVGLAISQDSVPDALWMASCPGATPDGGIAVRAQQGAGCM